MGEDVKPAVIEDHVADERAEHVVAKPVEDHAKEDHHAPSDIKVEGKEESGKRMCILLDANR